jgi:hypothetical protein
MNETHSEEEFQNLLRQLEKTIDYSWRRRQLNRTANWSLTVVLAACTVLVAVFSVYQMLQFAAITGAFCSAVSILQNKGAFGEYFSNWEAYHNNAKSLRDRIRYRGATGEEFSDLLSAWLELRKSLVEGMPKGERSDQTSA